MNHINLKICSLLILLGFVVSCASYSRPDLNQLDAQRLQKLGDQKVDNFLIIMDRSQSMDRVFDGERKLDVARTTLARMNDTLPEIKLMSGLRTYGYHFFSNRTQLIYGMSPHSRTVLRDSLIRIDNGGSNNYLDTALYAAATDLESSKGNIALFIVSDGIDMPADSTKALNHLSKAFGNRLCVYPITIGNDESGKAFMDSLAGTGSCSFAVTADEIASPEAMAEYVYKVFFLDYQDSDGDGVIDPMDKCPKTPVGVMVDETGCEKDSDGDGVLDSMDKCPKTPKGAKVNSSGCWILAGVHFDTAKATIMDSSLNELNSVVRVLKDNPGIKIMVQGFTDNVGNADYNLKLSESRAQAVMAFLVEKGIAPSRLSAKGFGINNPIATNSTAEGRAKNRRVELKPVQ